MQIGSYLHIFSRLGDTSAVCSLASQIHIESSCSFLHEAMSDDTEMLISYIPGIPIIGALVT